MLETNRTWALVPAAGVGKRLGSDKPKQYLPLAGKTILEHTLERLRYHPRIDGVVLVIAAEDPYWPTVPIQPAASRFMVTTGGAERCHSVVSGLRALQDVGQDGDWVLVHDAARPCLRRGDVDKLIATVNGHAVGGVLGAPIADTIKKVDERGVIVQTVSRQGLWRALTPQMFRLGMLLEALESALAAGVIVTDESSALERLGQRPLMVEGHGDNIKITHQHDLYLAETILHHQGGLA